MRVSRREAPAAPVRACRRRSAAGAGRFRAFGALAAIALALASRAAAGGWAANATLRALGEEGPFEVRSRILLGSANLRIDAGMPGGRAETTILYASVPDVLWVLDHRDKTYWMLDAKVAAGVGRRVGTVYQWMRESLGGGPADDGGDYRVKPTEDRKQLAGLPGQRFEVRRALRHRQDLWVTTWRHARMTSAEFEVFRSFARSCERIRSSLAGTPLLDGAPDVWLGGMLRVDGYPLLLRQYDGRAMVCEVHIGPPAPWSDAPSEFALPAGYRKQNP